MGKLVLVTGVTGYIGSHVCKNYIEAGYKVRGTVRDKSKKSAHLAKWIENGDLELFEIDLLSESAKWKQACAGVEFVAHVASPFFIGCPPSEAEEKLYKPARQGTENVLQGALDAGTVKRVVVTSSIAAVTAGHEPTPFLEKPEEQWSIIEKAEPYSASKTMAERAAWAFVEQAKKDGKPVFELATVNPSLVIGPPLGSNWATSHAIPKRMLNREMPALPDISYPTIDVRDVALAHRLATEKPDAAGKRFILQEHSTSFQEWSMELASEFKKFGYNPPTRHLPYFVLWIYARFDETTRGILPQVGRVKENLDCTLAKNVLGMEFRGWKESVVDHAHSRRAQGLPG